MKKILIDRNGEVREITKEDFKRMRPASEVVPEIVKAYKTGKLHVHVRGPQKTPTKVQTTIRLSQDVLSFFRINGKNWQTRVDRALREYIKAHS